MSKGVAVITGAAAGIGAGLARQAAAAGYDLVLADIDEAGLADVAGPLEGSVSILARATDVSKPSDLDTLAAETRDRFGAPTMLFANAGIEMAGNTWELSADQWDRIIGINIAGAIHTVRAFARPMVERQQEARIALTASLAGLSMLPVKTPYIVSKHAVVSFAECLSLEMQRRSPQVKVSVICPGPVSTSIVAKTSLAAGSSDASAHQKRMGEMVDNSGMTGDQAAEIIFAAVQRGDFWVSTHPDLLRDLADGRGRYLSALAEPSFDPAMSFILGDD